MKNLNKILSFFFLFFTVFGIVYTEEIKNLPEVEVVDFKNKIIQENELLGGLDKVEVLEEYKGKPTVVLVAGTFCPHCKDDVPEIEEKIFDKTGDQINLVINVVDGEDGKRFDTEIPQKFEPALDYKILTGEECGYVPSWVILDSDSKVVNKSCGNDQGTEGIIKTLTNLNITFDKEKIVKKNKEDRSGRDENDNILIYILILIGIIGGGYWAFKK